MTYTGNCLCGRVVHKVCPWGPRPAARWKRPVLFLLSLLGLTICGGIIFLMRQQLILVLATTVVLYCGIGLLVSLFGCKACVAQMLGDLGT